MGQASMLTVTPYRPLDNYYYTLFYEKVNTFLKVIYLTIARAFIEESYSSIIRVLICSMACSTIVS